MLSYVIDIGRVRQYLLHVVRAEMVLQSTRADIRYLDRMRRGLIPLPLDRPAPVEDPFPPFRTQSLPALAGRRVAVIATGGSGVLASVVGVARALEEAGVEPVGYGVCSGSALFGVPLAAGMSPARGGSRYPGAERSRLHRSGLARACGRTTAPGTRMVRPDPRGVAEGPTGACSATSLGELTTPRVAPRVSRTTGWTSSVPDTHPVAGCPAAPGPLAIQPAELDSGLLTAVDISRIVDDYDTVVRLHEQGSCLIGSPAGVSRR